MIEINKIYNENCFIGLKRIDDNSIDSIIIDPPYGLIKHKIETKIDIPILMKELYRVLKIGGFLSFFGMMPTATKWNIEAEKLFRYKEHISWVKRCCNTIPRGGLWKAHESLFIYTKEIPVPFINTKGKYTDIKIEGIYFDIYTIQTFKRAMELLQKYISTGKSRLVKDSRMRNDKIYKRNTLENLIDRDKCIRENNINFTNVWSFLSHNQQRFNTPEHNIKHPTVKPIQIMKRLVELTTREGELILDCFIGSGTTALACIETKRNYIGFEIDKEYCDICKHRIINYTGSQDTEEIKEYFENEQDEQLNLF